MRTLLIAGVLVCLMATRAVACDVCGCSIGGNYFGILPQFNRHFVGVRWTAERSRTATSALALRQGRYHSEEYFRSADLVARFYPGRRWQVLALAPYRMQEQRESGRTLHAEGLGDVSLLAHYILLNTGDSTGHRWQQTLTLGGGVKLPVGRSDLASADGIRLHPNLQLGSGSTDLLFAAAYTLRQNAWGWNSDVLFRLNTANADGYHYGNRVIGSSRLFYWKNIRQYALLPNAGVFLDAGMPNRDHGRVVPQSEGTALFYTLGLDVYAGRFSTGLSLQPPLWQTRETVEYGTRWTVHANFIF